MQDTTTPQTDETTMPDFDSIIVEHNKLPYDETRNYVSCRFSSPRLAGYQAIMVEDSVPMWDNEDSGKESSSRLSTMIARYPRYVLAEVNTHRVFSRNTASSRARNVRSTIRDVINDPVVPLFTQNKKGMSGDFLSGSKLEEATKVWLESRNESVKSVLRLLLGKYYREDETVGEALERYYDGIYGQSDTDAISVHKQNVNRLLEPYMWVESVISSTYWDNFFMLRTDLSTAQPEVYAIALLMERVLAESTPVPTRVHLPFVSSEVKDKAQDVDVFSRGMRDALMLSSTEAAQISYRDKSTASRSTATVSLGERLLSQQHLSPFEHSAVLVEPSDEELYDNVEKYSSNFNSSWAQARKILVPNQDA